MTAKDIVPRFAQTLKASPLVEENAIRALNLSGEDVGENEWAPRAAAALMIGAVWAGETYREDVVARATGVPEYQLVRQLAKLSEQLEETDF